VSDWFCPYCGTDLPDERAAHCGEVGHAEPHLEVKCARCGKEGNAGFGLVAEEGDEWECFDCWERCNAKERAAQNVGEGR
jgi:DNA-directed RNA polymerase subunit RPC12/RpoP